MQLRAGIELFSLRHASAEISSRGKTKSIWSFGSLRSLGLPDGLFDPLHEERTSSVEDVRLVAFFDLDFVFLCPKSKIRYIWTISKAGSKTAAPTHKIFSMQIR